MGTDRSRGHTIYGKRTGLHTGKERLCKFARLFVFLGGIRDKDRTTECKGKTFVTLQIYKTSCYFLGKA